MSFPESPVSGAPLGRELTGQRAAQRVVTVVHRDGARQGTSITGRLVGFRLPVKEADEARNRVRREHGANTTEDLLEAAGYVILFTTAPALRLSAARCVEAYRLRWQVELQLKRWKSICHFDKLPNYRDDTMLSWVTAKVLLGLLLDRIERVVGLDHTVTIRLSANLKVRDSSQAPGAAKRAQAAGQSSK